MLCAGVLQDFMTAQTIIDVEFYSDEEEVFIRALFHPCYGQPGLSKGTMYFFP